jgi:hypothetical protein
VFDCLLRRTVTGLPTILGAASEAGMLVNVEELEEEQ